MDPLLFRRIERNFELLGPLVRRQRIRRGYIHFPPAVAPEPRLVVAVSVALLPGGVAPSSLSRLRPDSRPRSVTSTVLFNRHHEVHGGRCVHLILRKGGDCSGRDRRVDEPRNPRGDRQQLAVGQPVLSSHQGVLDVSLDTEEPCGPLIVLSGVGTVLGGISVGLFPEVFSNEDDRETHNVARLLVDPHVPGDERRSQLLWLHAHFHGAHVASGHAHPDRVYDAEAIMLSSTRGQWMQRSSVRHAHEPDAIAERPGDEPRSIEPHLLPELPPHILSLQLLVEFRADANHHPEHWSCGPGPPYLDLEIVGSSPGDSSNSLMCNQGGLSRKPATPSSDIHTSVH